MAAIPISAEQFSGSGSISTVPPSGASNSTSSPISSSTNENTKGTPISSDQFSGSGNLSTIPAAGSQDIPGTVTRYAAESADPASTVANPDPTFFQKVFSGTPLVPITPQETSTYPTASGETAGQKIENSSNQGLKLMGSMFANVVSDTPAAAANFLNLLEPWKYPAIAKSLIQGGAHITSAAARDISHGFQTGDWSQFGKDIDKVEITVGNHPLQSALFLDGGLDAAKTGLQGVGDGLTAATDPNTKFIDTQTGQSIIQKMNTVQGFARDIQTSATDPNVKFMDTPTGQSITSLLSNFTRARANITKLFEGKTTLDEHTSTLGDLAQQTVDNTNKYTTAKKTVESFNDQQQQLLQQQNDLKSQLESAKVGEKASIENQIEENQQRMDELNRNTALAQKTLQSLQDQDKELFEQKTNEVNQETANQQKETRINGGFSDTQTSPSLESDLASAVSDISSRAFSHESGLYNENLGNVPFDPSGLIKGFEGMRDALPESGNSASIPKVQDIIDELKLRKILNSGLSDSDIYKSLYDEGIDPKKYEDLNLDQLKKQYPPVTTGNVKSSISSYFDRATKTGDATGSRVGRMEYMNNVDPAYESSFEKIIKENFGQDRVDAIKQNDKNWARLRNNPLFDNDANITLSKIVKNWESFKNALSQLPEGSKFINRVQNFVAERILNNAENLSNPSTFDFSKILKGMSDYKNVLDGSELEQRLQRVANDNKSIENEKAQRVQDLKSSKKQIALESKQKSAELKSQQQRIQSEGKNNLGKLQDQIKTATAQASKISQDAEDIGADTPDFVKSVLKIDSPEKLQSFIEKSGKSAEEIGAVVIQKAFSEVARSLANGEFNPDQIGDAFKIIDKIGSGDSSLRDQLLGSNKPDIEKLRTAYEQYKTEEDQVTKNGKGKTILGRIGNVALGSLLLALGGMGRFFAIRRLISGITPESSTLKAASDFIGSASDALRPVVNTVTPLTPLGGAGKKKVQE